MQARGRLLLLFLVRHTCPASGAMPPPPPQGSDPRARAQVLIRPAHLVECVRPFLQRMESHGSDDAHTNTRRFRLAQKPRTSLPLTLPVCVYVVDCLFFSHAGEMREWIQVLDRPHPQLLVQFWEYIHLSVALVFFAAGGGARAHMRSPCTSACSPHGTLCLCPIVSLLCSGVQKNGSVVVHLLKTKPATTRQQLQAMALLPIEEAVQWRCARNKKKTRAHLTCALDVTLSLRRSSHFVSFRCVLNRCAPNRTALRRNRKLPPTSAMLLQRAVASVTPERSES